MTKKVNFLKKEAIALCVTFLVLSIHLANAQQVNPTDYLQRLPDNIKTDKTVESSYQMTTDHYDFDLKSNFSGKRRLTGVISYKGDSAQWKDVFYAESKELEADFPIGVKIDIMQNFTYQPDEKVLTTEFFQTNLPKATVGIMNLIWDALAFDVLAYSCWDSLKLNKEFRAINMNSEFEIANFGTFENRDIRITWLGITEINNQLCAILKYSVMNNPLKIDFDDNTSMIGRSHYWGEVYVSLSDKQIEYASLTEDIVTDVKMKGQANNMLGYTVRTIHFVKVK